MTSIKMQRMLKKPKTYWTDQKRTFKNTKMLRMESGMKRRRRDCNRMLKVFKIKYRSSEKGFSRSIKSTSKSWKIRSLLFATQPRAVKSLRPLRRP